MSNMGHGKELIKTSFMMKDNLICKPVFEMFIHVQGLKIIYFLNSCMHIMW